MSNVVESSIKVFQEFLEENEINHTIFNQNDSIITYIDKNFDKLNDEIMKKIISKALEYRKNFELNHKNEENIEKQNYLGLWGSIVDGMKTVIANRKSQAERNFQELIHIGISGNQPKVDEKIKNLFERGLIDYIFLDILNETLQQLKKNKNDNYYMVEYFSIQIKELMSSKLVDDKKVEGDSYSNFGEYGNTETIEEREYQKKLIITGNYLEKLIKESSGDINALKKRLLTAIEKNSIGEHFEKVLDDNIEACERVGYQNKLKLLKFIKQFIRDNRQSKDFQSISGTPALNNNGTDSFEDSKFDPMSTYHAPKFVEESKFSKEKKDSASIAMPDSFIDGSNASSQQKVKNNKNKKAKKQFLSKYKSLAEEAAEHLKKHRWVVIDNYIPLELVRRVRIEANLFKEFYEHSEIWVGKQADVGAHLTVPSVRGDKILWMCGGHLSKKSAAPEGVSRNVRTLGEVEPCRIDVKASAPIKKFNALKDLIRACDRMVEDLKPRIPDLSGIFERSDAMLANYPGEGSRFACHIDNTTQDGRRLTLLIYLNPEWNAELGGALRLTSQKVEEDKCYLPPPSDSKDPKVVSDIDFIDILPHAGRLALFYSSEVPHEVRPAFGDRHAVTIWYYDLGERKDAIERSKEAGIASSVSSTSIEAQSAARNFISDLMGGDEVGEDGGNPSPTELQELAQQVTMLSDEVVGIISSITGAPSIESFRKGFEMLTVEDLKSMRKLFRNMGLQ